MQATGGEKSLMVFPRCESYELKYQPARKDVPTHSIVA